MPRLRPLMMACLLLTALAALAACRAGPGADERERDHDPAQVRGHGHEHDDGDSDDDDEEVELAPFMSSLQRYSQKLGYAIAGKNRRLAEFYLEEIGEVVEQVEAEVPEHDGIPIAQPMQVILDPAMPPLKNELAAGNWPAAQERYEALIASCNRCHSATEHEFIVIRSARGEPPFNQDFRAQP